jgi:hypothetical protein
MGRKRTLLSAKTPKWASTSVRTTPEDTPAASPSKDHLFVRSATHRVPRCIPHGLRKLYKAGIFYNIDGQAMHQTPGLPTYYGRRGLLNLLPPKRYSPQPDQVEPSVIEDDQPFYIPFQGDSEAVNEARLEQAELKASRRRRYQRCKAAQWKRWREDIIPSLVNPFLEHTRLARSTPVLSEPEVRAPCGCGRIFVIHVVAVSLLREQILGFILRYFISLIKQNAKIFTCNFVNALRRLYSYSNVDFSLARQSDQLLLFPSISLTSYASIFNSAHRTSLDGRKLWNPFSICVITTCGSR